MIKIRHIFFLGLVPFVVYAQHITKYTLSSAGLSDSGTVPSAMPSSNTINDVYVQNDTVWFATAEGPSYTLNGGVSWINLAGIAGFDTKGISAIAARGNLIWMAVGYTTTLNGTDYETGGGLHYSTDHGATWNFIAQPVDFGKIDTIQYGSKNNVRVLDITVPQQNITYDIALTRSAVWIASWAGMLRKSIDSGNTWQRIILPADNMDAIDTSMLLPASFDVSPTSSYGLNANYNNSLFAIIASDDTTLWAGTADGINKSNDGGLSWKKFSHQNQAQSISGDFVVALKMQVWKNRTIIWAATNNANDPDEKSGISYSSDGGNSWQTALIGSFTHNIACKDSIVYVATDQGVYRSSDFGASWSCSGTVTDQIHSQRFTTSELDCVGAQGDTVWVGGPDGIAYTIDNALQPFGSFWNIDRTAALAGKTRTTYAYPNPFSPDIGYIRIHFSTKYFSASSQNVDIRILNFAMQPVRTLLQNAPRASGEFDEVWDGKDDRGKTVANGVYFYFVSGGGQSPVWGKILVIR